MGTLMRHIGISSIKIDGIMIAGGGLIGEMVARRMASFIDNIKIIEKDRERCSLLAERLPSGISIINGDSRNTDLLLEEGIKDYSAFIALTDSCEANILSCTAAKKLGVGRTIAQVENLEYIPLAESIGVDAVINKKLITAGRIFKFTLSDKVRFIKYMSGTNAEVIEFVVAPGSRITRAPLCELDFPEGAIIGGVVRGDSASIAVGSTRIEPYDRVAVFALPGVAKEVDRWFK